MVFRNYLSAGISLFVFFLAMTCMMLVAFPTYLIRISRIHNIVPALMLPND